jgi:hypothetical protein
MVSILSGGGRSFSFRNLEIMRTAGIELTSAIKDAKMALVNITTSKIFLSVLIQNKGSVRSLDVTENTAMLTPVQITVRTAFHSDFEKKLATNPINIQVVMYAMA